MPTKLKSHKITNHTQLPIKKPKSQTIFLIWSTVFHWNSSCNQILKNKAPNKENRRSNPKKREIEIEYYLKFLRSELLELGGGCSELGQGRQSSAEVYGTGGRSPDLRGGKGGRGRPGRLVGARGRSVKVTELVGTQGQSSVLGGSKERQQTLKEIKRRQRRLPIALRESSVPERISSPNSPKKISYKWISIFGRVWVLKSWVKFKPNSKASISVDLSPMHIEPITRPISQKSAAKSCCR